MLNIASDSSWLILFAFSCSIMIAVSFCVIDRDFSAMSCLQNSSYLSTMRFSSSAWLECRLAILTSSVYLPNCSIADANFSRRTMISFSVSAEACFIGFTFSLLADDIACCFFYLTLNVPSAFSGRDCRIVPHRMSMLTRPLQESGDTCAWFRRDSLTNLEL